MRDVVIHLRRGAMSGHGDSVVMDRDEARSVYLPVGVGHMFVSFVDDFVMPYTLSTESCSPTNGPSLFGIRNPEPPLPADLEPVLLSERDTVAITLTEAWEAGHLPDYEACRKLDTELSG